MFHEATVGRYVKKNYTFGDGTILPQGSFMPASAYSVHINPDDYPSTEIFNPFRFSGVRDEKEEESLKHQMTATSADYLPFGLGKHAWLVTLFNSLILQLK